jgi:hypothetical protein
MLTDKSTGPVAAAPAATRKVIFASAAGFLGWTLDAFDFFLVIIAQSAIAKDLDASISRVQFSLTLTLIFRPVGTVFRLAVPATVQSGSATLPKEFWRTHVATVARGTEIRFAISETDFPSESMERTMGISAARRSELFLNLAMWVVEYG